jgi:hypothetical protein
MSREEMTPERLDAILDGSAAPTDDEARDMLALAARLRQASPPASDRLRERIRGMPQPHTAPVGRLRRLLDRGWRGRMLVAAPALAAVVAVVVGISVLNGSSDPQVARNSTDLTIEQTSAGASDAAEATATRTSSATVPGQTSKTPPPTLAPPAADGVDVAPQLLTLRVALTTLTARVADLRRLVENAGGTVSLTDQQTTPPSTIASITVPQDRRTAVFAEIANLGGNRTSSGYSRLFDQAAAAPATEPTRILVTEAPLP